MNTEFKDSLRTLTGDDFFNESSTMQKIESYARKNDLIKYVIHENGKHIIRKKHYINLGLIEKLFITNHVITCYPTALTPSNLKNFIVSILKTK